MHDAIDHLMLVELNDCGPIARPALTEQKSHEPVLRRAQVVTTRGQSMKFVSAVGVRRRSQNFARVELGGVNFRPAQRRSTLRVQNLTAHDAGAGGSATRSRRRSGCAVLLRAGNGAEIQHDGRRWRTVNDRERHELAIVRDRRRTFTV